MCERNVPKIIALGFEDILERVFSAIAGKEHESRRKGEIKDHDGGGKCSKRTNQGGMVISEQVQTIPSLEARCVSDQNRDFNYRKIMYEKGEKGRQGEGRGARAGRRRRRPGASRPTQFCPLLRDSSSDPSRWHALPALPYSSPASTRSGSLILQKSCSIQSFRYHVLVSVQ